MAVGLKPIERPKTGVEALDIGGLPQLGIDYKSAMTERDTAAKEYDVAAAEKSKVRTEGADRLEGIRAQAPAAPVLQQVPETYQHKGISSEDMTGHMQTMFALAAIGGMMTRKPMTTAIQAFSGALKGLQQGDALIYKRGAEDFDRNMKIALAKNQEAVQSYQLAMSKNQGDLAAAMQQITLDAAAHGDTMTAAIARKGDANAMIKHIQAMVQSDQQARMTLSRLDQQHQETMARLNQSAAHDAQMASQFQQTLQQRDRQFNATQERLTAADRRKSEAAASGGKPAASIVQHYQNSNQLVKSADKIRAFLQDPAIAAAVDQNQLAPILFEGTDSNIIKQFLLRPNIPENIKPLLNEVINIRNRVYRDQSGQAVTGGEAMRNYGGVVQPGDKASDLKIALDAATERANTEMQDYARLYPSLGQLNGGGAQPNVPRETSGPQIGEKRTINGTPAEWDGRGWKAVP